MNQFQLQVAEVPYFGRNGVVKRNDPLLIQTATEITKWMSKADIPKGDACWRSLLDDLTQVHNYLINSTLVEESTGTSVRFYRMQLLLSTIVPYLKSMSSRMVLDKDRFQQLHFLLSLITQPLHGEEEDIFYLLDEVQKITQDIDSKRYFWKSELGTNLRRFLENEWRPIIRDHRRSFRKIGGILTALGVIELVGRPAAILYPIYTMLQPILKLSQSIKTKSRISPDVIIDICKASLLLAVVTKFLYVLEGYNGLGMISLVVGILSIGISVNENAIKLIAPSISSHLLALEKFFLSVHEFEKSLLMNFQSMQSTDLAKPATNATINIDSAKQTLEFLTTNPMIDPSVASGIATFVNSCSSNSSSSSLDDGYDFVEYVEDEFSSTDMHTNSNNSISSSGSTLRKRK